MKKKLLLLFACITFIWNVSAQTANDFAVKLTAVVTESPASITLKWNSNSYAVKYSIYKKNKSAAFFPTTPITTTNGTTNQYTDNAVAVGIAYDYMVVLEATFSSGSPLLNGYGAISTGIRLPQVDYRGNVLILVDTALLNPLSSEILRFQTDLLGDGWQSKIVGIATTDSIPNIKNTVFNWYITDTINNKALILLGHIPVPYSGNFGGSGSLPPPDGHSPQHNGAWPTDAYYANMRGTWTDQILLTNTNLISNVNYPNDGKFDQTTIPGSVVLQTGRIDMFDLNITGLTYVERTRRYLNKDHNYRHCNFIVPRRSIYYDGLGVLGGEAPGRLHAMNQAPLFGDSITQITANYFNTVKTNAYLFSGVTSTGGYTNIAGVGTSNIFSSPIYTVFQTFLASYNADFDNTNNFMRSSIAGAGYTLTSCWVGRPFWHFYHMGMGENIGYSTLVSQNNKNISGSLSYYTGYFERGIHMNLLGDPTLRLHMIHPVNNLLASPESDSTNVRVTWVASTEQNINGYHIYRSNSPNGKFIRLNNAPITDTFYLDTKPLNGQNYYMVRTGKLELTSSGSYNNLSQGKFVFISGIDSTITVVDNEDNDEEEDEDEDDEDNNNCYNNKKHKFKRFTVSLYPNPTDDFAYIKLNFTPNNHTYYYITDTRGRTVISKQKVCSKSQKVNVSRLKNGAYYVFVVHNNKHYSAKLIKVR